MANVRDRILLVTNDPIIQDFIGRQALQAAGFAVDTASSAGEAVNKAIQLNPDIIITDLNLPGLSGKDLLVALSAQKIETPVIIVALKGMEADIIQTFRLGAADYLLWPVREAEVISAVERLLKQVHERREREKLARQLQQANSELNNRVRELTTIFSIGKAVTTVIDQSALFEKILDGALSVSHGDLGWFLLKDENSKAFLLVAQRHLPPSLASQANQPLDDGISSLVAMSGEPLAIFGEPLKRFRVSTLGQSALIVPIKVQKQVIGLLVVLRKQPVPFSASDQHLLEAVADYASISLVNARLFRAVEERARSLQSTAENAQIVEKIDRERLEVVRVELNRPLEQSRALLGRLMRDPAWWSAEQKQMLEQLSGQINQLLQISAAIAAATPGKPALTVNELVKQSVERLRPLAMQRGVALDVDLPEEKIPLPSNSEALAQVLDGLISNAIKFTAQATRVSIRLEKTRAPEAHLTITDCGPGLEPRVAARIFEKSKSEPQPQPFGGIGIRLPMIQEITGGLHGKVWVESKPGQGASFHVTLPIPKST